MSANQNIVYVLKSDRHVGRYYTGLTSDMERRLEFHNAGMSRHTSNGCPWRVVTTVTFGIPCAPGNSRCT